MRENVGFILCPIINQPDFIRAQQIHVFKQLFLSEKRRMPRSESLIHALTTWWDSQCLQHALTKPQGGAHQWPGASISRSCTRSRQPSTLEHLSWSSPPPQDTSSTLSQIYMSTMDLQVLCECQRKYNTDNNGRQYWIVPFILFSLEHRQYSTTSSNFLFFERPACIISPPMKLRPMS